VCDKRATDRYQRVIALCKLPAGTDVNEWLVRQGWTLATGFIKTYRSEQDEAEAAKRGIWAGSFTLPWKWRQEHSRECGKAMGTPECDAGCQSGLVSQFLGECPLTIHLLGEHALSSRSKIRWWLRSTLTLL
jgi:hypothetical protein